MLSSRCRRLRRSCKCCWTDSTTSTGTRLASVIIPLFLEMSMIWFFLQKWTLEWCHDLVGLSLNYKLPISCHIFLPHIYLVFWWISLFMLMSGDEHWTSQNRVEEIAFADGLIFTEDEWFIFWGMTCNISFLCLWYFNHCSMRFSKLWQYFCHQLFSDLFQIDLAMANIYDTSDWFSLFS